MGACIGKTESSNALGTAGLHAELVALFGQICRLAPELTCASQPSEPYSVSITISPAPDLNPACSNCPETLGLLLRYFKFNTYVPLRYLALVKQRLDDDDEEQADELLREIREGRELLLKGLKERKDELEEKLKSVKKWKRVWSAANSALVVPFSVLKLVGLASAKVPPVAGEVVDLLGANMKAVDPWIDMTANDRVRKLESQKDAIEAMHRGNSSALLLLLPNLERIRVHVMNLKKDRVSSHDTTAIEEAAEGVGQIEPHVEREAKEKKKKKKKVEKAIKAVRKLVDRVEGKVKKAAADLMNIIAK